MKTSFEGLFVLGKMVLVAGGGSLDWDNFSGKDLYFNEVYENLSELLWWGKVPKRCQGCSSAFIPISFHLVQLWLNHSLASSSGRPSSLLSPVMARMTPQTTLDLYSAALSTQEREHDCARGIMCLFKFNLIF
jgi:hypothetical protein